MIEMLKNGLPDILDGLPLFPKQASTVAGTVDTLYLVWVALSVIVTVGIFSVILFLAIRYRRRHAAEVGAGELHAPAIEIVSMTIPFVIAMAMFAWGTAVYVELREPPKDAVEYFAFGKQWMWKYQHPNGRRQINDFTIPADTPIKMTMTSEDVIHSFFIPDFRVKQDVLPGRYTTVWFEATEPGEYRMLCAEYCGSEHSLMGGIVTVLERDEYEAWLQSDDTGTLPVSSGEQLFTSLSCSTCHQAGSESRGPSLHGLFGTDVQIATVGDVTADENYIRESILEPRAKVRSGYMPLMPTFKGQVSEEELHDLVAYIKTLNRVTRTADTDGETSLVSSGG
ncbi:MAG: cytochrome c oxidase subunit II [Acidobacteriota bacterium]